MPSAIIQIILTNKIQRSPNWRHALITIVVFSSYLVWNLFAPEFLAVVARGTLFSFSSVIQTMYLISCILECCWCHRSWSDLSCTLHLKQYWNIYITMQSIKVRDIFKRISSVTFPSIICYSDMIETRDEHKGTQNQQWISTISVLLKEEDEDWNVNTILKTSRYILL